MRSAEMQRLGARSGQARTRPTAGDEPDNAIYENQRQSKQNVLTCMNICRVIEVIVFETVIFS